MKSISKQLICISIILLLVGVSYTSAIRVENKTLNLDNQPPSAPSINGPAYFPVDVEKVIALYSVDPDGDNISYYIEWGDGTSDGWTDYIPSGQDFVICHKYEKVNWDNVLRAKAKDIHGNESDWTYMQIPIVKSKDCGCNEVSDADIVKLEKQLDRFERYSKLLLVLSKDIPELKFECEEFNNKISIITDILEDFPIICDVLEIIMYFINDFGFYLMDLQYNYPVYSIQWILIGVSLSILELILYGIVYLHITIFDCYYYHPPNV